MIESITIRANPVMTWEQYTISLTPGMDHFQFSDFRMEQRNIGGFWTANFSFFAPKDSLLEFMDKGLGRDIQVWNSRGQIAFEGYINTIRLNIGTSVLKISLAPMANKLWVRYKVPAGSPARTSIYQDANSQLRYGTKEMVVSAGEVVATDVAEDIAETYLSLRAWPKVVPENVSLGGGTTQDIPMSLSIDCLGYYHTLMWRVYNQTDLTGSDNANTIISTIISAVGQFVTSTALDTNQLAITKVYDNDRWAGDIITDIARAGDVFHYRWVIGMKDNRKLYYARGAAHKLEVTA